MARLIISIPQDAGTNDVMGCHVISTLLEGLVYPRQCEKFWDTYTKKNCTLLLPSLSPWPGKSFERDKVLPKLRDYGKLLLPTLFSLVSILYHSDWRHPTTGASVPPSSLPSPLEPAQSSMLYGGSEKFSFTACLQGCHYTG